MGRWRLAALAIAVGLVVAIVILGYATRLGPGDPAPPFQLATIDGSAIALTDYQDRYLLLHFWATWCGPCREEIPQLEALRQRLANRNLTVLSVSLDDGNVAQKVGRFQAQVPFSFPVLIDAQGELSREMEVVGVPETFLIGPGSIVIERFTGPQKWDDPEMLGFLMSLLEEDDVSP